MFHGCLIRILESMTEVDECEVTGIVKDTRKSGKSLWYLRELQYRPLLIGEIWNVSGQCA